MRSTPLERLSPIDSAVRVSVVLPLFVPVFLAVVGSGGKATMEGPTPDVFEMVADKSNYPVMI